jgi:hypothetical protein
MVIVSWSIDTTLSKVMNLGRVIKNNIKFINGDRFFWAIENVNSVIEILSDPNVCAGVCAYIWDRNYGYRICDES